MFENLINGFARVIYKTENYYTGQYKDGKRHGKGKYVYTNGEIEEDCMKKVSFKENIEKNVLICIRK